MAALRYSEAHGHAGGFECGFMPLLLSKVLGGP